LQAAKIVAERPICGVALIR